MYDHTGRTIVTKSYLQAKLKEAALQCGVCPDDVVVEVYFHARDSSGCDWSVKTDSDAMRPACVDCLTIAATQLQAGFNLADPSLN